MNLRAIVLVPAAAACLALSGSDDGRTAYNFLDITSSTHVYGLGGVNVSMVDDDVNVIDQNPALLGPEFDRQLNLNYMRYVGSSNFAGVRYASAAGERAAWSVAVQYFGYGDIRATDADGGDAGVFSPKDVWAGCSYSHDLAGLWRAGISFKAVYSAYESYTALALAVDLGVNYFDEERDLSFGAVVTNLGGQVKRFNDRYDRLPVDVKLGVTKGLGSVPFRVSVTARNLTKWHLPYVDAGDGTSAPRVRDSFMSNLMRHLVFGLEYVPSRRFYIGAGFNYKSRTDMAVYSRDLLSGMSVCAGLNVSRFGIGVALARPHVGATTLMVNLTTRLYEF